MLWLLKATQHKIYRQEIPYLKNKEKSRQPPIIRQLDLYLDDEDIIPQADHSMCSWFNIENV